MKTSTRVLFAVGIVGCYLAVAIAVLFKIHNDTPMPPQFAMPRPPEPFQDPPGVTPQMRINATFDCLRRIPRCE